MSLFISYIITSVLATAVLVTIWWLTRRHKRCPNCGARQGVLTGRDIDKVNVYSYRGGEGGGGRVSTELDVTRRYRCRQCAYHWQEKGVER